VSRTVAPAGRDRGDPNSVAAVGIICPTIPLSPSSRNGPSWVSSIHASPGDILIDDWEKYRDLWIAKGGVWITHRSAVETIVALNALGL
jgi:hypothetical protein